MNGCFCNVCVFLYCMYACPCKVWMFLLRVDVLVKSVWCFYGVHLFLLYVFCCNCVV
jgi:hypothetical protein